MGVDNEDLRSLIRQSDGYRGRGRGGQIHVQAGAIVEVQAARHIIAVGAGGHQGAPHNVRRGGGGDRRGRNVVQVPGGLSGGEIQGRLLVLSLYLSPAPCQQQWGLAYRQPAPAVQLSQGPVLRRQTQLRPQGCRHEGRVLPQLPQRPGSARPGAQGEHPYRQRGQKQGRCPAQQPPPQDLFPHVASSFVV